MVQNALKIDGTLPYRGKPALFIHVLHMPGFEPSRIFFKILQGVCPCLGDPIEVHLKIDVFGVGMLQKIINWYDSISVLFELEIVVVVQKLKTGGLTLSSQLGQDF